MPGLIRQHGKGHGFFGVTRQAQIVDRHHPRWSQLFA